MSTFVVRFVGTAPGTFRGKVRHVQTGEDGIFSSPRELFSFFERMNAGCHEDSDAEPVGGGASDTREDGSLRRARTGRSPRRPKGGPAIYEHGT